MASWLLLPPARSAGRWLAGGRCRAAAGHADPRMPPPQHCVVIDRAGLRRTAFQGRADPGDGQGYGLLEQWIARLDCYTVREEGADEFSGDVLAVLCPSRPVTDDFRRRLIRYVAAGGKLLVIDSPENQGSTADGLLAPFGLSIRRDQSWKGRLTHGEPAFAGWRPAVDIDFAWQVPAAPMATLGQLPVAATAALSARGR